MVSVVLIFLTDQVSRLRPRKIVFGCSNFEWQIFA
jgi:hypothetical protein